MPISGPVLASLIQAQFASSGIVGTGSVKLSNALGNGIVNSILATAVYNGVSTGLGLGVGSSTGILSGGITVGPIVGNLVLSQLAITGFLGSKTPAMANAIGNAVALHMITATVQGVSTVVAAGTGTGVIIGVLGPTVGSSITLQMTVYGIIGSYSSRLAFAIGNGISAAMTATIANTVITGVPVGPVPPAFPPIPIVGSDTGRLI